MKTSNTSHHWYGTYDGAKEDLARAVETKVKNLDAMEAYDFIDELIGTDQGNFVLAKLGEWYAADASTRVSKLRELESILQDALKPVVEADMKFRWEEEQ